MTRDTKLDAKRAAAPATLAERFMKREEREIVRPSSFALAFSGLDVKTRKRRASSWLEFATVCVLFRILIIPKAFHEKQKPRAVDESETIMLMIVLQINSNYFDGRFPRLDNCLFERQLAKAETIE